MQISHTNQPNCHRSGSRANVATQSSGRQCALCFLAAASIITNATHLQLFWSKKRTKPKATCTRPASGRRRERYGGECVYVKSIASLVGNLWNRLSAIWSDWLTFPAHSHAYYVALAMCTKESRLSHGKSLPRRERECTKKSATQSTTKIVPSCRKQNKNQHGFAASYFSYKPKPTQLLFPWWLFWWVLLRAGFWKFK